MICLAPLVININFLFNVACISEKVLIKHCSPFSWFESKMSENVHVKIYIKHDMVAIASLYTHNKLLYFIFSLYYLQKNAMCGFSFVYFNSNTKILCKSVKK